MKTAKVLYWITTILLVAFILPGVFFMNSELAQEGMKAVQAPVRLGHLVGYGQPLAILLVLFPVLGKRVKEWAYVALGIIYIGALYAHLYLDGFVAMSFMPLVTLALLIVSYICWHKMVDGATK